MPNLNVKLSQDVYDTLLELKLAVHARNWVDFFRTMASGEVAVGVEFLRINDGDPKEYTVDFKLGDFHYRWENGDFKLLSSPVTPWRRKQALKAFRQMGGLGASAQK